MSRANRNAFLPLPRTPTPSPIPKTRAPAPNHHPHTRSGPYTIVGALTPLSSHSGRTPFPSPTLLLLRGREGGLFH